MTFSWHDILLMVIPFIIFLIVKPEWDAKIKYGITLAFCCAASAAEFYLAVWLVGSVQSTFLEAFSKSFLVIFATYAAVLKFPIPGPTIAARLESTGEVRLPNEVLEVLAAKAIADRKAAEAQQVMTEALKAGRVVVEEKRDVAAKEEAVEAKPIEVFDKGGTKPIDPVGEAHDYVDVTKDTLVKAEIAAENAVENVEDLKK